MHLRDAFKYATANMLAGNATKIEGPPGVAKTDLALKLAKAWKDRHPGKRVGVSTFFMADQNPMTIMGTPWKGTQIWEEREYVISTHGVPIWYLATDMDTGEVRPASLFDTVVLIIEEWGQGSLEAKRSGAEIMRAGGVPGFYMPPGSPRIALSNTDARDGVTKEFDYLFGRFGILHISGSVQVWLEDFADKPYNWQGKVWNVMPVTKAWAKQHEHIVFEPKPEKQGPWCNPRSLTNADRNIQAIMEMCGGTMPVNDSAFTEAVAGHIGMPATQSYIPYLHFQLTLPSYESVVADPEACPVPTKMDEQMIMAYQLAGQCQREDLAKVIKYMTKKPGMSADLAATFITTVLRRDYSGFLFDPAMQAWVARNANIMSVINAMSQ